MDPIDLILNKAINHLASTSSDVEELEDVEIPSFREFVQQIAPQIELVRHVELCIDVLQRVGDGEINHVMIFMPPRHGKSTIVQLFSAWFMLRRKGLSTITASYAARRAEENSRDTQRFVVSFGASLLTKKLSQWSTTDGSELLAIGVGGGVSGFDGHCRIIDDPFSGARAAQSVVMQHRLLDWYLGDFDTRATRWSADHLESPIILVQTLWSDQELAMSLVKMEREFASDPELADTCAEWHVLWFPAIYTGRKLDWPKTFVVYDDWREEGEALAPTIRSLKQLKGIKRRLEASGRGWMWNSLYQQDPRPPDGKLIPAHMIDIVSSEDVPQILRWYRAYDLAFTKSKRKNRSSDIGVIEADNTAGVLAGLAINRHVYFRFDILMKQAPGEIRQIIEQQLQFDPPGTVTCLETAHAGLAIFDEIERSGKFDGHELISVKPGSRDKLTRALGWIARARRSELHIIADSKEEIEMAQTFIRACMSFRNLDGDFDDPIDALSVADEVMSNQYGEEFDKIAQSKPTRYEVNYDEEEDDW